MGKSAKDIEGPWCDPGVETGLIERCRDAWDTPIEELSDVMIATFLAQRIALSHVIPEAKRRVAEQQYDETELYEGQMKDHLDRIERE